MKPGHAYLERAVVGAGTAFYAIGFSEAPGRRFRRMELRHAPLLHTVWSDDALGLERYWHQRLVAGPYREAGSHQNWILQAAEELAEVCPELTRHLEDTS